MRTVSFVEFAEFDYHGNIFSKAIIAADVDNDNNNELVIGNVDGELYIYKGLGGKPWATATDLGMITCVEVGDVCNHGINYLVILSADGWCNLFSVRPDASQDCNDSTAVGSNSDLILKSAFKQRLPANNKVFIIADIDGDGLNELVIGYTDKVVRSYKWSSDQSTLPPPPPPLISSSHCPLSGRFILTNVWMLAGQIGSITINKCSDGRVIVMVSQPGGTFVTLLPSPSSSSSSSSSCYDLNGHPVTQDCYGNCQHMSGSVVYHPLGSIRARNANVATEVVSSISRQKKGKEGSSLLSHNYSAICTLDGTLTLVDDDKILWSLYVDHQLFALTKLDITGDGIEEVIACSWDGQTYIVNLSKEVVRFHFRENVAAFCVGLFTIDKDHNVPCLFYATFNNKIVVYYNLKMSRVGTSNLLSMIDQKKEKINFNSDDPLKQSDLQQLLHLCLYGTFKTSSPSSSCID